MAKQRDKEPIYIERQKQSVVNLWELVKKQSVVDVREVVKKLQSM